MEYFLRCSFFVPDFLVISYADARNRFDFRRKKKMKISRVQTRKREISHWKSHYRRIMFDDVDFVMFYLTLMKLNGTRSIILYLFFFRFRFSFNRSRIIDSRSESRNETMQSRERRINSDANAFHDPGQ